jgi:uncharacterized PurR-regulated membrane protein YhhQ (DUF165 family)
MIGMIVLLAYIACIPLANWMIGHIGACIPAGPCLVPVGFGLSAPSGVIVIGFALVLRDMVQRRSGWLIAIGAIFAGTALSAAIAPPSLVLASAAAFLLSELADFAIYTPLQRRGLVLAVAVSSLAGLVVDSLLFLTLAFGSLDYLAGQIVGKAWAVLAALPVIHLIARRA